MIPREKHIGQWGKPGTIIRQVWNFADLVRFTKAIDERYEPQVPLKNSINRHRPMKNLYTTQMSLSPNVRSLFSRFYKRDQNRVIINGCWNAAA